LLTLDIIDADEICDLAAVRDLSMWDALFKSVTKNTLSDEWKVGAGSMIMVVCLAFQALIKTQDEQLNKIGVARTAVGTKKW